MCLFTTLGPTIGQPHGLSIQYLSDDREMSLVDVNAKTNNSKPRTMFLYYDSMGDRRLFNCMPAFLGVQHFLNFAYTYLLGCDRGNHKMKHTNSTPFGVPDFNAENFISCPAFHQAVIEKKSAFWVPLQKGLKFMWTGSGCYNHVIFETEGN